MTTSPGGFNKGYLESICKTKHEVHHGEFMTNGTINDVDVE